MAGSDLAMTTMVVYVSQEVSQNRVRCFSKIFQIQTDNNKLYLQRKKLIFFKSMITNLLSKIYINVHEFEICLRTVHCIC